MHACLEGWRDTLTTMLGFASPEVARRPLYTCPPEQTWTSHTGVVLLGDTAHVMPSFTGRCANMVVLDVVELTEQLADKPVAEAIAAYDASMLARLRDAGLHGNKTHSLVQSLKALCPRGCPGLRA